MARRVEDEAERPDAGSASKAQLISKGDFKKLLAKLKAGETKLSEGKGEVGSAIDTAISRHNIHKDALRLVRKYLKKDPTAQSEFLLHLETYWGHADLAEPADDLIETPEQRRAQGPTQTDLEDAIERAGGKRGGGRKAKANGKSEPLGKPTHQIKGGKVVPISGEDEGEPEAEPLEAA